MRSVYLSIPEGEISYYFLQRLIEEIHTLNLEVIIPEDFQKNLRKEDIIREASIVICFVTANNPNFLFEIGLSVGLGKDVLLINLHGSDFPNDLKMLLSIEADSLDEELIYKIIGTIRNNYLKNTENAIKSYSYSEILAMFDKQPDLFEMITQRQFEDGVIDLLKSKGYEINKETSQFEYGYDCIINNYKNGQKAIVQIKKYSKSNRVSIGQIQQLLGSMYFAHVNYGIFITSSDFTSLAFDFKKRTEKGSINFIELWTVKNLGSIPNADQ